MLRLLAAFTLCLLLENTELRHDGGVLEKIAE